MTEENAPALDQARKHINLASEHFKLDNAARDRLYWAHEAAIRTVPGGVVYTNAAGEVVPDLDTAGWLRSVERDSPDMLRKPSAPRKVVPTDLRGETVTQLFAAARSGNNGAQAELERRMRTGDGTHEVKTASGEKFNLTELFAKAAMGDQNSLKILRNYKP